MSNTRISLFLCMFGFLKEFQPSAPFAIEYFTGTWKNFTREQIQQDVMPMSGYSYLATLLPVLLLADFLRYKPIIILCGLSGSCAHITLVFAKNLWGMKIFKSLIGLSLSTEIAYFAYIYAKVDKEHYQEITSHVLAALSLGKFVAGVTGQFLVSFELLNYHQLNYLTISGSVLGTIWTLFLPSVSQSIYLNRKTVCDTSETLQPQMESGIIKLKQSADRIYYSELAMNCVNQNTSPSLISNIKNAYYILWKDFLLLYSQAHVLKWSAWWVFTMSGYMQVIVYIQVLWQTSFTEVDDVYNGAVEASQMILGTLATLGAGKLRINWSFIAAEDTVLTVLAMIQGILLLVAAETSTIWISYAAYIGFCIIFQATNTIASFEIAKSIPENSYGLILGLIMFAALVLQALLTFTVTESWGLALAIRSQYVVYGGYFIALGAVFMVFAMCTIVKHCKSDTRS